MSTLNSVVKFDIGRLFNGAIDVDWLISDPSKAERAAQSFVFHGPAYHGVMQKDIASSGHRLIDSASFFKDTIARLSEDCDQPFTVAIAGFGSGKSHIALTLTELLENAKSAQREAILNNIAQADEKSAKQISNMLPGIAEQVLVITLNGMNNFDLSAEILGRVKAKFIRLGIQTDALDSLRKRFTHAANILKTFENALLEPLFTELNLVDKEAVLAKLASFDETVYIRVHEFLQNSSIPLIAIGDETAKDVLKLLASQYVGEGKPFKKILIMFDEFGRYLEFATTNSQIAGNGALQQLYEGIQENSNKITFIGFIQYELKAYEQRLPSDFKNDIRRFITRFQASEKLYLSINLETLIASLLTKSKGVSVDGNALEKCFQQMQNWFPAVRNHSLWNNKEMFLRVIGEGCFPLSPLAVWILFHLSAGGQYLQQRSALSLLRAALDINRDFELSGECPFLPPVRLWSGDLQHEFLDVEEQTGHGAVMQSYVSVFERYQQHLSDNDILLLRSIALVSITRLKAESREDAIVALRTFSGVSDNEFSIVLHNLEEELNVISWDDSFRQFDIIGDSVSKSQFLKFLRQKLDVEYDIEQQEKLFIKKAELASEHLSNIECDFAGENKIISPEWIFEKRYTYWSSFTRTAGTLINSHIENTKFNSVENARGLIIYCYVSNNESLEDIMLKGRAILRSSARDNKCPQLPIILALVYDSGEIGKIISELDVVEKLTPQEQEMYGKIAAIHITKRLESFKESIKQSLLQRNFITTFSDDVMPLRLAQIGNFIFDKIYSKPLPFPFDAYRTSRTNAAKDCADFTRNLLLAENFSFDSVQSLPMQQRNRATNVLKSSWKIFNTDGSVAVQPGQTSARSIVAEWEKLLQGNKELNCGDALEIACAAPYGANIASAGLLFSVYVQARQNITTLVENEERIEFSIVGDRLFEGNVLSIKTLSGLTLYKADNADSEWEQLLNDWGNAASYMQLTEFAEQAEGLEARIQIPKPLRWKAQELQRKSEEAKRKIEETDEKEDKAYSIIERAIQAGDIYNLSYGASLLQSCGKRKTTDPMWRTEDYAYLADKVTESRQIVIQGFDEWLKKQLPSSSASAALADFKGNLLDKMGRNLERLELKQQNEQLKNHYERISRNFEAVANCQLILNSIGTWLASHATPSRDMTLAQIKACNKVLIEQVELLKPAKKNMTRLGNETLLAEITDRFESLSALNKKLKALQKIIEDKAKNIWSSSLTPETVDELHGAVSDLERLYSGEGTNVEDFRVMKSVVQAYVDILRHMKSTSISTDDFKAQIAISRSDFLKAYNETESPWDLEEAFDLLEKYCVTCRNKASKEWEANIQTRLSGIAEMTTAQANDLLRAINTPPPYVDLSIKNTPLEKARERIEQYLNAKEVEWLLERFKQMPSPAQKAFIEAITSIKQ